MEGLGDAGGERGEVLCGVVAAPFSFSPQDGASAADGAPDPEEEDDRMRAAASLRAPSFKHLLRATRRASEGMEWRRGRREAEKRCA